MQRAHAPGLTIRTYVLTAGVATMPVTAAARPASVTWVVIVRCNQFQPCRSATGAAAPAVRASPDVTTEPYRSDPSGRPSDATPASIAGSTAPAAPACTPCALSAAGT